MKRPIGGAKRRGSKVPEYLLDHQGFLLRITSVEEFVKFVAFIRRLDEDAIQSMTERLKTSTEDLSDAVEEEK